MTLSRLGTTANLKRQLDDRKAELRALKRKLHGSQPSEAIPLPDRTPPTLLALCDEDDDTADTVHDREDDEVADDEEGRPRHPRRTWQRNTLVSRGNSSLI